MKNSDHINWASRRVGNSDMNDLNCSVRLDSAWDVNVVDGGSG